MRVKLDQKRGSATKDEAVLVKRDDWTFNEFVNPDSDIDWDEKCVAVHGLHPEHAMIRNAEGIDVVWARFEKWLKELVSPDETVILVAWNGESCDLKWLWKLTQAPCLALSMPPCVRYYLDPRFVISKYTS